MPKSEMEEYEVAAEPSGHESVTTAQFTVTAENEQDAVEKVTAFVEDTDMTDLHVWET